MVKISFNILYWDGFDSETRLKNISFCYEKLNKFIKYSNTKNMNIKVFLFDFSEKQVIKDSIHIPYKNNEYRRSEKMNRVLEYNNNNFKPDIFCCLDSDVFFIESEYEKLINELNVFNSNSITICSVLDIQESTCIDYTNNTFNTNQILVKPRLMAGLGAFYIINFNNLFNIGGFDERFICWGGEDDEVIGRLINKGYNKIYTSIQLFHLPHKSLSNDSINSDQYKIQCQIIGNNDTITKHSLITNKYLKNGSLL